MVLTAGRMYYFGLLLVSSNILSLQQRSHDERCMKLQEKENDRKKSETVEQAWWAFLVERLHYVGPP